MRPGHGRHELDACVVVSGTPRAGGSDLGDTRSTIVRLTEQLKTADLGERTQIWADLNKAVALAGSEINREQGTTVLLTTHDLVDVERLCERLLIIDHGLVIEDGTVTGITERYGRERTLVVDLVEPGPPLEIEGAAVTRVDGPRQWLRFRRDDVSASELLSRVTRQVAVRDLSVEEPDIESIVREIYAR